MPATPPFGSTAWRRAFHQRIRRWYQQHGRELPWRHERDPYRIWVREIMLQQTTVAAVVPYLDRFLARFPSLAELAAAPLDDVLRLWEGLGYYTRARNLHRAAVELQTIHQGSFPRDVELLTSLPGLGRYTAGAIASFAFDLPAPIVEANTRRLYARLMACREDLTTTAAQRTLWSCAESVVPAQGAGEFNQALMDLGATVCTPQAPRCSDCPVLTLCQAAQQGCQAEIPVLKPRAAITDCLEYSVAIRNSRGEFLLRQRPAGERWAGLWDFVRGPLSGDNWQELSLWSRHKSRAPRGTRPLLNLPAEPRGPCTAAQWREIATAAGAIVPDTLLDRVLFVRQHAVTRYRIQLVCVLAHSHTGLLANDGVMQTQWVTPLGLSELALSVTGRLLADRLTADERQG